MYNFPEKEKEIINIGSGIHSTTGEDIYMLVHFNKKGYFYAV